MTPALQAQIQQMVESFQTTHNLPGMSVAVVTPNPTGPNPVITTFAAGHPAWGSPTPVDASTQFELGSESKIFTADLLSYLVASGQVALDDEVQHYAPAGITVPEWTDPTSGKTTPITLRDLATHQAGLPDLPPNFLDGCGLPMNCANPRPGYTQTMLWNAFDHQQLLWRPGTRWLYSDWGFGLLGTILANVVDPVPASQPPAYQSALDGAFLNALGLFSTTLEAPSPRLAVPYSTSGSLTFSWDNTNAFSGAGGLISDAADMGAWVAAHLGYIPSTAPTGVQSMATTLHPVSTITTMCSTPTDCGNAHFQMGLGWRLFAATSSGVGVPWAFKNGDTAGSSTDTALAPSLRTGVTTMFNRQRVDNEELAIPILALLVADQPAPTATPTASPGAGTDPPRTTALADSGYPASDLLVPGLGAAALLAVGVVLAAKRRKHSANGAR